MSNKDGTTSGLGGQRDWSYRAVLAIGLGFDSKHQSSPGGFQKQGRDMTQFRPFKGLLAAGWGRITGARVGAGEPGGAGTASRGGQVLGDSSVGEVERGKWTRTGA